LSSILQSNLSNIFHLFLFISAPIFLLNYFFIGCTFSAPDGSSPRL
jgi:hypothetical protein